jgi:hypothetical protein
MQYAILRSKPSKVWWFRVLWNKIDYACREDNGSLKPVPPGTTRKQLYCGQCRATKCFFTGKKVQTAQERKRQEAEKRAKWLEKYARDKARKRARGLDTASRPLKQNCWNCCEIRIKLGGFVCRFEPEAEPASMGNMIHRKADGCQGFGWRREVAIPPLDGDGADCDPPGAIL